MWTFARHIRFPLYKYAKTPRKVSVPWRKVRRTAEENERGKTWTAQIPHSSCSGAACRLLSMELKPRPRKRGSPPALSLGEPLF